MAVITSISNGGATALPLSANSSWAGGVAPVDGDTIVIANGTIIKVNIDITLGSKTVAVGHAVTINGASSSSYGELQVAEGITLTLRGTDHSTNTMMLINRYGKFTPQTGSTVLGDCASDYQSSIINNGILIADGVTFSIPPSNINWNNTSIANSRSGASGLAYDIALGLYVCKFAAASSSGFSPACVISNAAGTGIGAKGDSFTFTTTNCFANEVSTLSDIKNTGDYWIDYNKGYIVYKYSGAISWSATFKYAKYFGWGIKSDNNATYSYLDVQNCTFSWMGSGTLGLNGSQYAVLGVTSKSHINTAPTQYFRINSNTFRYCCKPIALVSCNGTSGQHLEVVSNKFFDCGIYTITDANAYRGANGMFHLSGVSYCDFRYTQMDSYCELFATITVTPINNIHVTYTSGSYVFNANILPTSGGLCYFEDNSCSSFGSAGDWGGIQAGGTDVNNKYYYRRNHVVRSHRTGRLANFMVVEDNTFTKSFHHAFVHAPTQFYISGYTLKNNQVFDSYNAADLQGGWSLGYNAVQWVDDVEVSGNTFDGCLRTINFNDQEGTIVLGTRLRIFNNICSRSGQGILRPLDEYAFPTGGVTQTGTNFSYIGIERLDYNCDYQNPISNSPPYTSATNYNQATFVKSGVEYHPNARNVTGVYLGNPTHPQPMNTGKTLQLVSSGTFGSSLSLLLSFGGGATQELVMYQGTVSTGSTTTTLVATGTPFPTTGRALKGQQVIYNRNGTLLYGMIRSNTSSTLTIVSNNAAGTWTAPVSGDAFVVIKSEVQLVDGSYTVQAGIHSPTLVVANGTYSDTGITIEDNHTAFAVDPGYTAPGVVKSNSALVASGYGGGDIGSTLTYVPKPVVSGFDLPASSASQTVTFSPPTVSGSMGVVYYLVKQDAVAPAFNDSRWTSTPPTSFTITGNGLQTVYCWARDDQSVSDSVYDTINITTGPPYVPTITITLRDVYGNPVPHLSNLHVVLCDDVPWNSPTPTYIAHNGNTDASGVFSITANSSMLPQGGTGWLVVTNSDGTTTQTPSAYVYCGPVVAV